MRPNQQPVADAPGRGSGPTPAAARLAVLAVPAAEQHVALVRLAVLQVGEVIGLDPERTADLRLAVAEACGQFLPAVPPGSPARRRASITVRFERPAGRLRVTVRGPVGYRWPDVHGLGWVVLSTLVGDLHWSQEGGVGTLTLTEHLPPPEDLSLFAL
jgi:hypothetical protein